MFKTEENYIKNAKYIKVFNELLAILPEYFFKIPASSTGKYHPKYALGEGGLVRHTKVALKIGYDLLNNNSLFNSFTDSEKDLLLLSILVHDGLKSGLPEEKYTRFDHPLLICEHLRNNKDKISLTKKELDFICNAVKTHMGEWTTDYNGNEVLEKPSTKYQKFVHMCDYLASRKYLDVNFKDGEIE